MKLPSQAEVNVLELVDLDDKPTRVTTGIAMDAFVLHCGRNVVATSSTPQALSRFAFARGAREVSHQYDGALADQLERCP